MKKENQLLQLYVEHYKANYTAPFIAHISYNINFVDPEKETLDNQRGHYRLAEIQFKNLHVGWIYIEHKDFTFDHYRLVISSGFHLPMSEVLLHNKNSFEPKGKHLTIQECINELENVRLAICEFYTA
jgi:hypothetical protein